MRGDRSAPLVLIHYGDFQCPYSAAIATEIREMRLHFKTELCVVFRHFPLPDLHPQALQASLAAQAAGEKFWQMHDLLFENRRALREADLKRYAQQIGLDIAQFEREFASEATMQLVADSVAGGKAAGAHGTPSIFINGTFHDNDEALWEEDALKTVLESARRAA